HAHSSEFLEIESCPVCLRVVIKIRHQIWLELLVNLPRHQSLSIVNRNRKRPSQRFPPQVSAALDLALRTPDGPLAAIESGCRAGDSLQRQEAYTGGKRSGRVAHSRRLNFFEILEKCQQKNRLFCKVVRNSFALGDPVKCQKSRRLSARARY